MPQTGDAMTNRTRGKNTERAIAKIVGGKRIGTLCGEDIQHDDYSIEVKNRVKSTAHGFMAQAIRNCPQGKTPMVIIHKHGDLHGNDLVCVRLKDWESWNGSITKAQP
jgi:hypothetical protein